MMKKVFMLAALLCCTLSGFAEKKPIQIEREKQPHGRSEVQLPTAFIDGQVLTISFESSNSFEVSVVDALGAVVNFGVFYTESVVLILDELPTGDYVLKIKDSYNIYSGNFEQK